MTEPNEPITNPGTPVAAARQQQRRTRFEDRSISYKHIVYALPFLAAGAVTFGGFVLNQAAAQGMGAVKLAEALDEKVKVLEAKMSAQDAGLRGEVSAMRSEQAAQRVLTDQKFERQDAKLDLILREVRKERNP